MTEEANHNTLPEQPSDKAGPILRLARIAIALGLVIGVGVFGVLALSDLAQKPVAKPAINTFGASDTAPTGMSNAVDESNKNPLAGVGGLDPNKFVPINRDNPHPGEFEPFINGSLALYAPHTPLLGGPITTERCAYQAPDATVQEAIAHYERAAAHRGMTLKSKTPTSERVPGGMKATWTGSGRTLQVAAWPTLNTAPPAPPLKPATPLDWVVQYSYPADQAPTR